MGKALTLKEAAEYLGVHYMTIQGYVKKGEIKTCSGGDGHKGKRGSTYLINIEDLESFKQQYIAKHGTGQGTGANVVKKFKESMKAKESNTESVTVRPDFVNLDMPDIFDRAGNFKRFLLLYKVDWEEYAKALCLSRGDILAKCNGKAAITARDISKLCAVIARKSPSYRLSANGVYDMIRTGRFYGSGNDPVKERYVEPKLEIEGSIGITLPKFTPFIVTMDSSAKWHAVCDQVFTSIEDALGWIKEDAKASYGVYELDEVDDEVDSEENAYYAYYVDKSAFQARRVKYAIMAMKLYSKEGANE